MTTELEEPVGRTLISHSEVECFEQCEKKHDYAHVQQLEPVTSSNALNRGNAGHFTLETFFKGIQSGLSNKDARKQAFDTLWDSEDYSDEIISEVSSITFPFIDNVWPTLGWKIVDVEKEFRLTIDDYLVYPFKVDLIIEWRGELYIVDHKFVYDVYDSTTIRLMPQMPRYVGALNMMGIPVIGGIYNFIRTRKLNNWQDRYSQVPNPMSTARIRTAMLEQVQEMRKINELTKLPVGERPIPVRTANKMNCGNCGFAELCATELETGKEATLMRKTSFKPNSYGYKDLT